MADLHPTLIRANVALFAGDYAEVRRLLTDYRSEGGGAAEHAPMALWLDAHAQHEPDERLRRLEALLTVVPPDNVYGRLAQTIIDLEQPAQIAPTPRLGRRGIVLIAILAIVTIGGLLALLNRRAPETIAQIPPTATAVPTAAPLPDRSRPLTADQYVARYTGGTLQVTAVEDNALRVVDADGVQVQPVPGARFFAVELAFECRIAICRQPPEAAIGLRLADDSLIEARTTVFIQNQRQLNAVALGVTTRGWVVFEIPSIVAVSGIQVTSAGADGLDVVTEIPLG